MALRDTLINLFSRKLVLTKTSGNRLKLIDLDKTQAVGNKQTRYSRYRRLRKAYNQSGWSSINSTQEHIEAVRMQLYSDYELMDSDAILSGALDVYADESTTKNVHGELLSITTKNENIKKILNNLFYDVLNIEFNLWHWARALCKNGDMFLLHDVQPKVGLVDALPVHPSLMRRRENHGEDLRTVFVYEGEGYTQLNKNIFERYEVSHFRLLSDTNYLPYGKSMVEGSRKTFKQLLLMEDAMLLHRIMRAPERRVFKIDVGLIPPEEVDSHIEEIINANKKIPHVNDDGSYNLRYNLMNAMEDFYLPVRGGKSSTEINTLDGLSNDGAITDIEYLRNKMMAYLKIPKAYLGYDADVEGKCISPDTEIPLISGETKTVRELIEDYKNGIINYTYSLDESDNTIKAGKITWAGFTRMNTQTVKVWLDNDKFIECTPDHKFLTRDGLWVEAQNLTPNLSLMPLYLSNGGYKDHYTTVYQPCDGKYKLVHRIVGDQFNIKEGTNVLHHIDYNGRNNNPENLDGTMSFWEHRQFHATHAADMQKNPNMIAYNKSPLKKIHCRMGGLIGGKISGPKLGQWVKDNGPANKKPDLFSTCDNCSINYQIHHYRKDITRFCTSSCRIEYQKNHPESYQTPSKSKYKNISYKQLIETAESCNSFSHLEKSLGITRNVLNKLWNYLNVDKIEFIFNCMPLALENKAFMQNYRKYEPRYLNHKVVRVEWQSNSIDTCDITVDKYHNFGTSAGVIIHNSVLAAEDIRFARTVERIQKVIVGELYKMAYVHLYTQGFKDEDLLSFTISLTPPSIIYERQKIDMLNEKMSLVTQMLESKLFSREYVYTNLFSLDPEEIEKEESAVIEDLKRGFREAQIEAEGNDPEKTGRSFGTPHDMAYAAWTQGQENKENEEAKKDAQKGDVDKLAKPHDPSNIKNLYKGDKREDNPGRPTKKTKFGRKQDDINGEDPDGSKTLQRGLKMKKEAIKSIPQTYVSAKSNAIKSTFITETPLKDLHGISMLNEESLVLSDDTDI